MIGLAQFFHATHTGTDHIFISSLIHTKAVDVEDYDSFIEQDLVAKFMHLLIEMDEPLEHISLYQNYYPAKKKFDSQYIRG
jgi:hypothetical protein